VEEETRRLDVFRGIGDTRAGTGVASVMMRSSAAFVSEVRLEGVSEGKDAPTETGIAVVIGCGTGSLTLSEIVGVFGADSKAGSSLG